MGQNSLSQSQYNQMVQNAIAGKNVSAEQMYAITQAENASLNPDAVNGKAQGLAQITPDTWSTFNPKGPSYSTDPQDQLNTQAKILSYYNTQFGGNTNLSNASYVGGTGYAQALKQLVANGTDPTTAIATAAANVYGAGSKPYNEIVNYKAINGNPADAAKVSVANTQFQLTEDNDPAIAQPVSGMTVSTDQAAALMSAIAPPVTITGGLTRTPWYADRGILQVNKATQSSGYPVYFKLQFSTAEGPLPISIVLNASLKSFQKSLRHVVTKQRTLTGTLVNLWGMNPDQITGSGSTGMFANHTGVSDFLSLSTVSSKLQQQVLHAFTNPDMVQADITESSMATNPSFFRMAAKDAFVELLSLFKNNGVVWFQSPSYNKTSLGHQQMAVDAWSPQTGSTTFQNSARRNDVMTRGKVILVFRNTMFYGFFKSLTWTMDADSPFRWNFNFVFQVESTRSNVTLPQGGR